MNEAVFNGRVLKDASLKAGVHTRQTGAARTPRLREGYGYGWSIGKFRGLKRIEHGGGLNGFSTYLMRVPEEN